MTILTSFCCIGSKRGVQQLCQGSDQSQDAHPGDKSAAIRGGLGQGAVHGWWQDRRGGQLQRAHEGGQGLRQAHAASRGEPEATFAVLNMKVCLILHLCLHISLPWNFDLIYPSRLTSCDFLLGGADVVSVFPLLIASRLKLTSTQMTCCDSVPGGARGAGSFQGRWGERQVEGGAG